jgi:hypothetical protein
MKEFAWTEIELRLNWIICWMIPEDIVASWMVNPCDARRIGIVEGQPWR